VITRAQLEARRQEIADVERKLATCEKRRERYEAVLGVVTNEWNSARDAIDALAVKVGAKASTTAAKSDGGAHVDAFLARLVALSGDDKALEGAGSGKRKRGDGESDRSVAETAEELEDGNSRFEDEDREKLVASLREKADVTKAALVGVLDALEAKTAGVGDDALKKRMDALEASRLKTKRDYDALSHAYLRDSARCKELQAELDEMEVLLMGTRRRLAIAKANGGDDTIEGLPKMATAEDARAAGAEAQAKAAAAAEGKSGGSATPVKTESRPGTPAQPEASATELAKLNGSIAELESVVKLNEKNIADLTKEKTALATQVRTLSDGQIFGTGGEQSAQYTALNTRYEGLKTENEKLNEDLIGMRRRMDSIMQESIRDRQAAERGDAAAKRLSSADERAVELETRLEHVVRVRDELEHKVRSLETPDVAGAAEEKLKMLEIVQKENQVLKDENKRFRESCAELDNAKVEKAAADERIKSLTESIASLEKSAAKKSTAKTADLEKQIAELKEKLAAAEATATAANAALEEKQSEVMMYVEEIEAISGAYAEAQEQSTRLLSRIAASEDAQNKAISERIAAQSSVKQFENECERVKEQAAYYKRDLENAYERTRELEEQLTEATTAFTKMQEEAGANTENVERSKAQLRAMERQVMEVRDKLTASEKNVATLVKRSEGDVAKLEAEKAARVKAETTATSLKKKCDRLIKEGGTKDLHAEVEAYKTILNCNVCQGERQKAVIITRCAHMFCEECVQKRIAARSRKCPGCSLPFSENDVMRIYF